MTHPEIIEAIEAHADKTGLAPSTICQYAVKNRLVYDRLKDGGYCAPKTAQRLMAWLHDQSSPASAPSQEAS